MPAITVSSELPITPDAFWAAQSLATVNYELGPWIHMTAPKSWQAVRLSTWQGQQTLFTSWVLLLGLLPVDRHAFGSFAFDPQSGFVEKSSSWTNALWQHERSVVPASMGCVVEDRVRFTPRVTVLAPVLQAIYQLVFRHRHNRLKARYGLPAG